MSDKMDEKKLERQLMQAEQYEDQLDLLHPEDAIRPKITKMKRRSIISSKLAVVVGHTRRSPGAFGVKPISKYEYFWNREIARLIKLRAAQQDLLCGVFYRDGIGISGAYEQVADWHPNASIELHFNAFNGNIMGTETLYGLYEPSERWARPIQEAMIHLYHRSGRENRGLKQRKLGERGGINVNQLKNIPSCLIEPYFGDALQDAALAKEHLADLAALIIAAHQQLYG